MKLILVLLFVINFANAAEVDAQLFKLQKETGCKIRITSGYRSPEENKRVGGSPTSLHLEDKARDIVFSDCLYFRISFAEVAKKYFTGVIIYNYHIHLDIREKPLYKFGNYGRK